MVTKHCRVFVLKIRQAIIDGAMNGTPCESWERYVAHIFQDSSEEHHITETTKVRDTQRLRRVLPLMIASGEKQPEFALPFASEALPQEPEPDSWVGSPVFITPDHQRIRLQNRFRRRDRGTLGHSNLHTGLSSFVSPPTSNYRSSVGGYHFGLANAFV